MTHFEECMQKSPSFLRDMKTYKYIDGTGKVTEYWERNEETGTWVNKTAEEELRQEIEAARLELQEATQNMVGIRRRTNNENASKNK